MDIPLTVNDTMQANQSTSVNEKTKTIPKQAVLFTFALKHTERQIFMAEIWINFKMCILIKSTVYS